MKRLITILLTMATMNLNAQVRQPAVSGQFYTADSAELRDEIDSLLLNHQKQTKGNIKALIVPHAGYVFSGDVAASAFAQIPADARYDHIFLLGPSHQVWLDKASVAAGYSSYQTPLGIIKVDTQLAQEIIETDEVFTFDQRAHQREHCLEVELPFLQRQLKQLPTIVPIIISTVDINKLQQIAEVLKPYFEGNNLFVISSDFSHYPSYDDAIRVDAATANAILTQKTEEFIKTLEENANQHIPDLSTSACGESAIAILLMLTENDNRYYYNHILYRNSGDSGYGEHHRVVGYHSFVITKLDAAEKKDEQKSLNKQEFTLTDEDKKELRDIAWQSIKARMERKPYHPKSSSETLNTRCGAFVTLHTKSGRLRGCIGHMAEDMPLIDCVVEMAQAAAFEDPRFYPVEASELDELNLEISVLTPMKRIHDISEFHLGRDGILIRKGYHSGTFLPQVANEVNWTAEEFLGHCAQDKAGIGWDGWRNAELYTYQAIIF